jgi:tRNA(Ile)-lysidine synthetase-like protein
MIIYCDQVNRHINRNNNSVELNIMALKYAKYIYDNNLYDELTPVQKCFSLMPFRHTFVLSNIKLVIDKVNEFKTHINDKKSIDVYNRFLRVSLLSYYNIQNKNIVPYISITDITIDNIISVLDKNTYDHINNKKSNILSEIIYGAYSHNCSKKTNIYKTVDNFLFKNKLSNISISLSCGVDSIVLSYVLSELRHKYNYNLIALHINYMNRGVDNDYELQFIYSWCKYINVPLYVQNIDLIKRTKDHDREFYEATTHDIRFQFYKHFNYSVVLGHNMDDCMENIISNINKKQCYNNLKGMNEVSHINDITIIRTLLNISKKEIYDFAMDYNILHLKTSTPTWSNRGRARDIITNNLYQYDKNMVNNFMHLSDHIKSIHENYLFKVINVFMESVIDINAINITNEVFYDIIFWKPVIIKIINNMSSDLHINVPSNKSIIYFVERINKKVLGKIHLSNNISIDYM